MAEKLSENELWLLSFYRTSEISGALFFGRLAKSMRQGPIQCDMTKHFSDEAQHAWYWTSCIERLGTHPVKLGMAYQDQYMAAAGMPANLMEVLALTQTFERRVINQYALHHRVPNLRPEVKETIEKIMQDERWHIDWVDKALKSMEPEYGKDYIRETLRRYWKADREVYQKTMEEHAQRAQDLIALKRR
ncbi:MAG: ferritin-like domain-containing protein [Nitrospiraceae bacterium]